MNYFLLCAYNEEKNISCLINEIRKNFKYEFKILVVDDGSTDNTLFELERIKSDDLIVLKHNKNLGLGCALKTGFLYIFEKLNLNDKDNIITMDADNTHPVELANLMVEKIKDGKDIVIASRYQKNSRQLGVPLIRKFLSFLARIILKILFYHPSIKDYTSGYRAYAGRIIKNLINSYGENFIIEKNFVVQLEILVKLLNFKPDVYELPICLKYYKKCGKSKLKIVKDITSYLNFIVKYLKR